MVLEIKGLPGIPADTFGTKKREFEVVVQGKFKNNVAGNKLYTGQCFDSAHIHIHSPWLIHSILFLIRTFLKDVEVSAEGKQYVISPMLSTTQRIST